MSGVSVTSGSTAYVPATTTPTTTSTGTTGTTTTGATTSTGSSTTGTAAATSSAASVSQDEFLKLLVAQMKYQDPDSPQDPTAFVTQLAQFSALEQSTQTNTQLASLTTATTASQRLEMSTLVGHGATAKTSQVGIQGAPAVPPVLQVHLPANATSCTVQITDASGNVVRTVNMGAQLAGDPSTNWLGLDDAGQALPVGTYNLKVTATGTGGTPLDAYAEVSGTVTAVDFGSSGTQLQIAGSPVDPANIISVQK